MTERRAKEVPSVTKPVGKPGDERKGRDKVNYQNFERSGDNKFQSKKAGDGYSHQGPAVTKSDGSERVRPSKSDYSKFARGESKFQSKKAGDGYSHQGPASGTPSKGDERSRPGKVNYTDFEKNGKKASPWKKFES